MTRWLVDFDAIQFAASDGFQDLADGAGALVGLVYGVGLKDVPGLARELQQAGFASVPSDFTG
jgi:hypothetical protein